MNSRRPYYISEITARKHFERGSHFVNHGFLNQVFPSQDRRTRTFGYVSAAYKMDQDPIAEAGVFSFKNFLTSYCPRSEASLIREVSLIYVRQINEAARLICQRTPPVAVNILAMQADIDEKAMRRLDTLLLRGRQPELVAASEMLEDFRQLSQVFK